MGIENTGEIEMTELSIFTIVLVVFTVASCNAGEDIERNRLRQKCLVEMEAKPHKEAVEICNERVK